MTMIEMAKLLTTWATEDDWNAAGLTCRRDGRASQVSTLYNLKWVATVDASVYAPAIQTRPALDGNREAQMRVHAAVAKVAAICAARKAEYDAKVVEAVMTSLPPLDENTENSQ